MVFNFAVPGKKFFLPYIYARITYTVSINFSLQRSSVARDSFLFNCDFRTDETVHTHTHTLPSSCKGNKGHTRARSRTRTVVYASYVTCTQLHGNVRVFVLETRVLIYMDLPTYFAAVLLLLLLFVLIVCVFNIRVLCHSSVFSVAHRYVICTRAYV